MRKCFVAITLLLTSALLSASVIASPHTGKWYRVEMIIFSHMSPQGLNSERWPWVGATYRPKSNAMTLSGNNRITPSNITMKREVSRLSKKTGYQILFHAAWNQQMRTSRRSNPIHIFGGKLYNASGKVIASDISGKSPYRTDGIWQVNGTIKISVLRYLNVRLNLLFATPLSQLPKTTQRDVLNNTQGAFAYFRLLQSRRMRSRELNYIGHPLYGVLIKIIPLA